MKIVNMVPLILNCIECGRPVILSVSEEALAEWNAPGRRHVQHVFPDLNADQREMLISRICPTCWDDMFSFDEDY